MAKQAPPTVTSQTLSTVTLAVTGQSVLVSLSMGLAFTAAFTAVAVAPYPGSGEFLTLAQDQPAGRLLSYPYQIQAWLSHQRFSTAHSAPTTPTLGDE